MRGEVRIGRSIYGVVVINGSLCSRVYGIFSVYIYIVLLLYNDFLINYYNNTELPV